MILQGIKIKQLLFCHGFVVNNNMGFNHFIIIIFILIIIKGEQ